jgi:hypothetical protein
MERFTDVRPVRPADLVTAADPLGLAVAAYLARFSGPPDLIVEIAPHAA